MYYPPDQAAQANGDIFFLWERLVAVAPLCPGVTPDPLSPGQVAVSYWTTKILPTSQPAIKPGYGVTGLRMFLETHGATATDFDEPNTPFGPLHIHATGAYTIDWGDGDTRDGPYKTEGQPFPDGTITHVWTDTATITITLTETWTATWTLGGQTGTLAALRTTSAIPAFHVRQEQAVND